MILAGATRIELATSGVTGRRSNQLNYAPCSLNPKFEYQNPKQIKK